MTYLLSIDIGTSSAKAVLFNTDTAQVTATAAREYPIHKPLPDRAEQNPDDWWTAAVEVARRVLAGVAMEAVVALSVGGQMHGTVLLGRDQQPLHPAIIWADQRSAAACARLVETLGAEEYAAVAGTLPAAGFLGATLLWLAQHEPALVERAHQVILPKDYVRLCLTGEIATEVTDAAGTGVFDINASVWASEILQRVGLLETLFPPVLASTSLAGWLTPVAAAQLGLKAGLPVIAGCADQPAQAIGNGLIEPGKASVTTGSGGQVFVPLRRMAGGIRGDPRLHIFNHAVPERWYILGAILSAGLSLRWLRNIVGLEHDPQAYSRLSAEAAAVPPGADGLIYLPYLSGERAPHMDAAARGGFIGLSSYHTRGHLARAVMEGVAFALRQTLEISLSLGGAVAMVIAAGGGGESNAWRGIQADVFGLPLQRSLLTQQTGVGLALLAGVGTGIYRDLAEACSQVARYGPVTMPDAGRHAFYDELYAQFLELYPRLRDDFHRLGRLSNRL